MAKFRDLEYCKIDLIAAKGIVFVKYAKSSSALLALESILANDCMVSSFPPQENLQHMRSALSGTLQLLLASPWATMQKGLPCRVMTTHRSCSAC